MRLVVLLSGPIAVGKTLLATRLIEAHSYQQLKSSEHLKSISSERGVEPSRALLQEIGDQLDEQTDFVWLVDAVARPQMAAAADQRYWLVDSVRKPRQIEHFRSIPDWRVLHVHVWAREEILRARYERRRQQGAHVEGTTSYEEAVRHPNEIASRRLREIADLAVNFESVTPSAAAAAVALIIESER